ncbi:hypothetical protein [Pseudoalteromonas sp. Of7M-16]|uniref:hypothetical protein n=1 Tax=Pseudoalteromonas sp. Of7M-16 TaxID=2917756 RepID=UPI001EF44D0E|nr:hypothetical protein [Pseudoalteromonas sp. Of7M-16]MCG7550996.1 hypothetical protein [Pseudoalteromonas sp. Of7M-16]
MNKSLIKPLLLLWSLSILLVTHGTLANNQSGNIKVFSLSVFSPDEIAPIDAKPVEVGEGYRYRYNPESHNFDPQQTQREIVFEFAAELDERYEFRWITADQPQHVSLVDKQSDKITVALDDGEVAPLTYFEVWVYDTQTGEVFMCDPVIVIRRPK